MGSIVQGSSCLLGSPVYTPVGLLLPLNLPSPEEKGAQTFAVLRHIALNLLRREPHHKRGIKARRKLAGWDRDYLVQVLTG
jgi:hypothetical protein